MEKNEMMNVYAAMGGEQTEELPGGGFHGGEQTRTLPGGGFHGGEQTEELPGGGFHGGGQTGTLPGGESERQDKGNPCVSCCSEFSPPVIK